MAALDPRIEVIREKFGLDKADFWELPQKKGTWIAKHAALEIAAAKAGITFNDPIIIEANSEAGIAALSVSGRMEVGNNSGMYGMPQWSIGEASPKNNKNAYPWAMAEKRAKDRVILKLIGIHGLVYSEDEADDFKERPEIIPADGKKASRANARDIYQALAETLNKARTVDKLKEVWRLNSEEIEALPTDWHENLVTFAAELRDALEAKAAYK